MNIEILPSDYFGQDIKKTTLETTPVFNTVDVTQLYNWYMDNIEVHISKIHLQGRTMLFKFIMEYFVTILSDTKLLYFTESFQPEIDENYLTDMDVDILSKYIENNGIPVYLNEDTNARRVLARMETKLGEFKMMIKKHLRLYGIDLSRTGIEENELCGIYIPFGWDEIKTDIVYFRSQDIEAYTRLYPYDKKLVITLVRVTPLDIDKLGGLVYLTTVLEKAVEPVYGQLG